MIREAILIFALAAGVGGFMVTRPIQPRAGRITNELVKIVRAAR